MDGTDEEELKKLNQMVRAALAPVDENVQLTEDVFIFFFFFSFFFLFFSFFFFFFFFFSFLNCFFYE